MGIKRSNKIVPTQTGNAGKYLTTDGNNSSWGTIDLSSKANIASPTFTGTVTVPTLSLTTADTATAATHYMVETASDGVVRPKTLANTRAEIVTTAAVNSASATVLGTVTSGIWQGTSISATYIDSAIARLASPTFTGTVSVTGTPPVTGTNTTQVATTAFVRQEISNLVDAAPSALDTLNELAAALADDANFSTTITNSIATRAPLASPTFTGTVTAPTILLTTADTVTAATHYMVETASDGIVRPKTLSNVTAEIVTTSTVNSASATVLGTVTSGIWQGTSISATYIDSAIARLASPTFTGTVTVPTLSLTTADTVTAATHYMVETASDGVVRPKTLSNVTAEIVTTAAVNSASATVLGTVTSGIWQGTSISATYIDSAIARLASPTFTGTPAAPTAAFGTSTTQVATTEFVQSRFSGSTIDTKVASYSLVLADAGKTIEMNVGSANNLTIPLNSSQALPIGTTIDIIQYGAGQTTLVATGGVTVRSKGGNLKLTGQYSGATLYKRGTDEWVVVGDLTS